MKVFDLETCAEPWNPHFFSKLLNNVFQICLESSEFQMGKIQLFISLLTDFLRGCLGLVAFNATLLLLLEFHYI